MNEHYDDAPSRWIAVFIAAAIILIGLLISI